MSNTYLNVIMRFAENIKIHEYDVFEIPPFNQMLSDILTFCQICISKKDFIHIERVIIGKVGIKISIKNR